eukprot:CFRG1033T1
MEESFAGLHDVPASRTNTNKRKRKRFDKRGNQNELEQEKDLLIFGYSCTIVDDASIASSIDHGKYLGPCMADEKLIVDRHDVRHNIPNLSRFKLVKRALAEIPRTERGTEEERLVSRQCDEMRQEDFDLAVKKTRERQIKDEETTRASEIIDRSEEDNQMGGATIRFDYRYADDSTISAHADGPHGTIQHGGADGDVVKTTGVTASSIIGEESTIGTRQQLQLPFVVPAGIPVPLLKGVHEIIVHTCRFLSKNSLQVEIALKASVAHTPLIGFLMPEHKLHAYYQLLKNRVKEKRPVDLEPIEYEEMDLDDVCMSGGEATKESNILYRIGETEVLSGDKDEEIYTTANGSGNENRHTTIRERGSGLVTYGGYTSDECSDEEVVTDSDDKHKTQGKVVNSPHSANKPTITDNHSKDLYTPSDSTKMSGLVSYGGYTSDESSGSELVKTDAVVIKI